MPRRWLAANHQGRGAEGGRSLPGTLVGFNGGVCRASGPYSPGRTYVVPVIIIVRSLMMRLICALYRSPLDGSLPLTSPPFVPLLSLVSVREKVGERRPRDALLGLTSGPSHGFDFSDDTNYRDALHLGDCDAGACTVRGGAKQPVGWRRCCLVLSVALATLLLLAST